MKKEDRIFVIFILILLFGYIKEKIIEPVTVTEIFENPEYYIGKEVTVNGTLNYGTSHRCTGPTCGCVKFYGFYEKNETPNLYVTFNGESTCASPKNYWRYVPILEERIVGEKNPLELTGTIRKGVQNFPPEFGKEYYYLDLDVEINDT